MVIQAVREKEKPNLAIKALRNPRMLMTQTPLRFT